MHLPNYFIADLPPEAELNSTILKEACATLRRNREHYLASRSTPSLIQFLATVAHNWLDPEYRFRKLLMEHGAAATGFSAAVLAKGLEQFFKQMTVENMQVLLEQDLGDPRRLEEMTATSAEDKTNRAALATAPELIFHITAGNIPCSSLHSMVLGVLLRSAQFIKCASGASFVPRLFAHSLYEADAKIGACIEIAEWPGGLETLENSMFEEVDCVTATGSDDTLASISRRVPSRTRFIRYGHRVSFAYVAKGVLYSVNAPKLVARAASDVVAWDQLGCLSPHVIYVEEGTGLSAEQFAEKLASELTERELTEPRGKVPVEVAASIASRRSFYEVRAAHSVRNPETPRTRLWSSPGSTAWTVVFEDDPLFQLSCLHRFIYVKTVPGLRGALRGADAVGGHVSTVGLAAPEEKAQELAMQFARWGAARVCPVGEMQNPSLLWRHDGSPALGSLVRWTDWEM